MLKIFNKKKGFTLIELLVVIAIIGLLSSIVLVSMGGTRKRARDARRQADLQSIMTAMEICYGDSECGAQDAYTVLAVGSSTAINIDNDTGPVLISGVVDPTAATFYVVSASSAQYYCVYARLESITIPTYFCVSNKGSAQSTAAPIDLICCGMIISP